MGVGARVAADTAFLMDPAVWKKVKTAFADISETPNGHRAAKIAALETDVREEVAKMLAANEADSRSLNDPIFDLHDLEPADEPVAIDGYTIEREIGHGGMGIVYEARRETAGVSQKVALKVIRRGMNNDVILKRFRSEQQILATLRNEYIARFLDGGRTRDGLPYFAMEFVDGLPITEYCAAGRSTEEIVALFRDVCGAVSSAHAQLVVHRDLKPSNIFVTPDGRPKLLDFGIAKVLDVESGDGTATQFGMMTPQYASPEQVRGEKVSTLTDVYSLGLILYELLTGGRPYETEGKNYAEILDTVTQSVPVPPSQIRGARPDFTSGLGDLDNIVMKALQKEQDRRYSSVEQFSEDLRRFLAGLPVIARADTVSYRLRRFLGRNRAAAAASLAVTLTLLGGIGATSWQAYRAEKQRLLAEKRFREVRTIANNVVFKYDDEIKKLDGSTAVREMIVADATDYLDNLAADSEGDIELERELALAYLKLGDAQGAIYSANTGNTAGALQNYTKSIELLEKVVDGMPNDVGAKDDLLTAYDKRISLAARTDGESSLKLGLLDKSTALVEQILRTEPRSVKRLAQLSRLYVRKGDSVGTIVSRPDLEKKLESHLKALQFADEALESAADDPEIVRGAVRSEQRVGTDYYWLGVNALKFGNPQDAPENFKSALPHHQRMFELSDRLGRLQPATAETRRDRLAVLTSLAPTLAQNGRLDEALQLARDAEVIARTTQSLDPANREATFDVGEVQLLYSTIYSISGKAEISVDFKLKARDVFHGIFAADRSNLEAFTRTVNLTKELNLDLERLGRQTDAEKNRARLAELQSARK